MSSLPTNPRSPASPLSCDSLLEWVCGEGWPRDTGREGPTTPTISHSRLLVKLLSQHTRLNCSPSPTKRYHILSNLFILKFPPQWIIWSKYKTKIILGRKQSIYFIDILFMRRSANFKAVVKQCLLPKLEMKRLKD